MTVDKKILLYQQSANDGQKPARHFFIIIQIRICRGTLDKLLFISSPYTFSSIHQQLYRDRRLWDELRPNTSNRENIYPPIH